MPPSPNPASNNPNPQGKGCVPLLQDWSSWQPLQSAAKAPAQLLRDYCLSSLVLAAQFQFRPVVGKTYYLYASATDWLLSLVSPDEWGPRKPGDFVAECSLRPDMTWHLAHANADIPDHLAQRLAAFISDFFAQLSTQERLEDHLPVYVEQLPYYQRVLATALSSSLRPVLVASPGVRSWLQSAASDAVPLTLLLPQPEHGERDLLDA